MKVENIKGIGTKTVQILNDNNIYTSIDLLEYYPFRYNVLKRSNIKELSDGDKIIIDGKIETIPIINYFGRNKNKLTFKFSTQSFLLNIVIFNRAYLKPKLNIGNIITVIGKYDKLHNCIYASEIRFDKLSDDIKIEPIYHSIGSISSNMIRKYISNINDIEVIEYIPEYLKEQYKLISKKEAIKYIHNPESKYKLKQALAYLKYEELFLFMLKINYLKNNKENKIGLRRNVDRSDVDNFINSLPFELSFDQKKAVDNIYNDLLEEKRMNRLIQGDVGSGKTIVAIIALYINYLSGYQGALMAPLEVLAQQHYQTLIKIFEKYNIKIRLLIGSLKQKEKKEIYEELKSKNIDIIIGTHALFSKAVIYNNLGLVITDEQHRFGVNQRSNLKNKGVTPDILYLSATPIPRTYALTIYGDMDISNIKTLPNGRKEIITYLKKYSEIKDVLNIMFNEIKLNHQIFVVAPIIEEDEENTNENVEKLEIEMNKAFGKICKIGILHGKMSSKDKEKIMNDFKENKLSILISTTVIEVGVDIKNATCIAIFDAYRFGLSQLHQLRGRVGRNNLQGYCILVSDKEAKRLEIMTETSDGFKISEEDFKLRGSGDLFGVKQSGDMSFKVANIKEDYNILLRAKEDTINILNNIDNYINLKKVLSNSVNQD